MKWPLSFPCLVRDWPTSRPPQSPSRDRTAAQWPAGRSAATPSVEVPARLSVGWPGRAQSESDTGSQSDPCRHLSHGRLRRPRVSLFRVILPSRQSESYPGWVTRPRCRPQDIVARPHAAAATRRRHALLGPCPPTIRRSRLRSAPRTAAARPAEPDAQCALCVCCACVVCV